jgi:hypothetical protein
MIKNFPKFSPTLDYKTKKNEIENRGYESYLTPEHHISDAGRNLPYAAALLLPVKFLPRSES